MKKGVFVLLFSVLLLVSFISFGFAVNNTTAEQKVPFQQDLRAAGNDTKTAFGKIASQTGVILSSDVIIPEYLQVPLKVVFGISSEEGLNLQKVVILVCLMLIVISLIHSIVVFIPFLNGGIKSWVSGLVIGLLVSISGAFSRLYEFWFNLANTFAFFQRHPVLAFIVALIILTLFFIGASFILTMMKRKRERIAGRITGEEIAQGSIFSRIFGRGVYELSEAEKKEEKRS